MATITPEQLLGYFEKACEEKWGYVWGLNGRLYTKELADSYRARRRSTSKWRDPDTYWTRDCARWFDTMAADCSGGIVGAFRKHGTYRDRTANTFFRECTKTGRIEDLPEVPGLCVWRKGHIGVYAGDGVIMEFRGTEYGCVKTRVKSRNFTHYGYLKDIDYNSASSAVSSPLPTEERIVGLTSPLTRGDDIRALQELLNSWGYKSGKADGVFGKNSEAALMSFVKNHHAD